MQIAYHLGAHSTDEDRLVRCLLQNRAVLAEAGIAVPPPGRYRPTLRQALLKLKGGATDPASQEALLDSLIDDDRPNRLVLSGEFFMGLPERVIGEVGLYPTAGQRASAIANLFPDAENEFHIAIRNPATLVPALVARSETATLQSVLGSTGLHLLRWQPVIWRITTQVPEARVFVWCNEDTPLLWPDILRQVAACGPDVPLEGEHAVAGEVMTEDGHARMLAFLKGHPPSSAANRRKIVTAFLEKFARQDAMEVEVPLPGWTAKTVADLTSAYEAECERIGNLPRVQMMLPDLT